MAKSQFRSIVFLLAVSVSGVSAKADDRELNELREKAAALQREAQELKQAGKLDQAQKQWELSEALQKKIKAATQKPGNDKPRHEGERKPPSPEAMKDYLRAAEQKIAALRAEGRNEEADKLTKNLKEAIAHRQAAQGKEGGDQASRQQIQHLLEAAEHLRAAGKGEAAEDLTRQAAEIKKHLAHASAGHEAHASAGRDRPAENRELAEQVQQLRREVQELREIVKRLAERVAK